MWRSLKNYFYCLLIISVLLEEEVIENEPYYVVLGSESFLALLSFVLLLLCVERKLAHVHLTVGLLLLSSRYEFTDLVLLRDWCSPYLLLNSISDLVSSS